MSGNERRTWLQKTNVQELIMSNLNLSLVAGYDVDSPALSKPTKLPGFSLGSFFERLSDAMYLTEQRRREREVAGMIADNGGVMTDELERQIGRRLGM
jgi:hypothetical protein